MGLGTLVCGNGVASLAGASADVDGGVSCTSCVACGNVQDRIGSNDYMGEVRIPMSEVMTLGEISKWYPLVSGPGHEGEQVSGEISIRVQVMVQGDLQTGNLNAEELRRFALQKMVRQRACVPACHVSC